MGSVEAIHLVAIAAGPPVSVAQAEARAGRGLIGDRYAQGEGTFAPGPSDRDLTLIEAEQIERAATEFGLLLAPGEHRRNITTRGIRLNALVGRRFRVGNVLCEGMRLCEPCAHLEALTGKGGLCRVLAGRAGLRARLLGDGVFRVGDAITVEPGEGSEKP